MKGFTQIRTCRLVASLIALLGAVFFLVQRVAVNVLLLANDAVQMGFKRYDSFTGRMALNNFEEDRQLFACMKNAKELLSSVEVVVPILLVVSIVLLVIACFGLIFPRWFGRGLVFLKLLKPETLAVESGDDALYECDECASADEVDEESAEYADGEYEAGSSEYEEAVSENRFGCIFCKAKSQLQKLIARFPSVVWIVIGASLVAIIVLGFAIRGCSEYHETQLKKSASEELFEQSITYVNAQKAFFNKNTDVGGAKALKLPDSLSTEYFTYKIKKSRFTATSNVAIGDCPAGTEWRIGASTNGIFFVDLILSRIPPKDTNCVKILPDFKNIGRKKQ